jgi:hypothetical protein
VVIALRHVLVLYFRIYDFEAALPTIHLVNGVMMRRNDIDI